MANAIFVLESGWATYCVMSAQLITFHVLSTNHANEKKSKIKI